MAGRVCMVKAVIIPSFIHVVRVYLLPVSILLKVEKAMRNFIWSGSASNKGVNNVCWNKVCVPHSEGGLNMTSIKTLNKAVLLYSLWGIFTSCHDGNVFIQKRLINKHNVVKEHHTKSSIGKGVCLHWPYINDNSRWICGFPSTVSFWFDKWLDYVIADRVGIPNSMRKHFNYVVFYYFIEGVWHIEIEFLANYPDIVDDIKKHRLSDDTLDRRVLEKSLLGDLSSKTSYLMLSSHYPTVNWGTWIWQSFIPLCRSTTMWKAIHNKLLT